MLREKVANQLMIPLKRFIQPLLIIAALSSARPSVHAQLFINELMARNSTGISDDFFEQDDWLEIYNSGSITNLAGYFLSDDPLLLTKWEIPNTNAGLTTVLPNSHLLFWLDNDLIQGEDHANFKLSGDGETVFLVMPDGITIVDSVTYPIQAPDISYGRSCDGCSDWVFFDNSTPDDNNMEVIPSVETLFINEVLVNNTSNIVDAFGEHEAWVEIYNPNPFQVNLARYTLEDVNTGSSYTFPTSSPILTTIDPEGFIVIWMDNQFEQGEDHAFTIDPSGELRLRGEDESIVDTYNYQDAGENISWGRSTDGGPSSISFIIPTPRVTNTLVIVEPELLYINEVMTTNLSDTTDAMGEFEDWFEVYNPGPNAINIAGYYFTDNPANPDKWRVPLDVPIETTIPAGGFLLFWADEDQTQGWNHTNFRLNNAGESLSLYSPDGFTLGDYVALGLIGDDLTYGRETDGSPNWVNFVETTPEYSNNGATVDIAQLEEKQLQIYPNPVASGQLVKLTEKADILVSEIGGKILIRDNQVSSIDTSLLSPGLYLVHINQKHTIKLLIN